MDYEKRKEIALALLREIYREKYYYSSWSRPTPEDINTWAEKTGYSVEELDDLFDELHLDLLNSEFDKAQHDAYR